jgi:hypothetical protein
MYIYLTTMCFNLCRSSSVNVHFENKGCSARRSFSIVGALAVQTEDLSETSYVNYPARRTSRKLSGQEATHPTTRKCTVAELVPMAWGSNKQES